MCVCVFVAIATIRTINIHRIWPKIFACSIFTIRLKRACSDAPSRNSLCTWCCAVLYVTHAITFCFFCMLYSRFLLFIALFPQLFHAIRYFLFFFLFHLRLHALYSCISPYPYFVVFILFSAYFFLYFPLYDDLLHIRATSKFIFNKKNWKTKKYVDVSVIS